MRDIYTRCCWRYTICELKYDGISLNYSGVELIIKYSKKNKQKFYMGEQPIAPHYSCVRLINQYPGIIGYVTYINLPPLMVYDLE